MMHYSSCNALDSLLLTEANARPTFLCTPQWAIVNDDFQIVELSNEAARFLQVSAGRFQNNIVHLARDSLRAGLRGALRAARTQRRKVTYDRLLVNRETGTKRVSITVQPMPNFGEYDELLVVLFQEFGVPIIEMTNHVGSTSSETLADRSLLHPFEQPLSTTQTDLEHKVQALEACNEELKASNEELRSIVEELQSHREEFETGRVEVEAAKHAIAPNPGDPESQLKSGRIATLFLDREHRIKRFTPAMLEIYNLVDSDIGRRLEHITHVAEKMPAIPTFEQSIECAELEHEFRTRDSRWYQRRTLTCLDNRGAIEAQVLTFSDITHARSVEQFTRSEEKMRSLLREIEEIYTTAPIGLCVLDTELRYVRINKHMADMNGLPVEAHLGRSIAELLPDLAATAVPALQQVLDSGEAVVNISISGRTPREPAVLRHWLESWLPMRNSKGEIFGVNIVAEDVTGQKRHEEQLLAMQSEADAARCSAEQASRSKSEFLANMSHEIRTPMTAILGYADLLALKMQDPKDLQSVQTIKRNGQFLVGLLDDILDLSRIEAGKMTLETRVLDPIDVVEQTRELMQVRADQQRLTLCVEYASKLPTAMHTDPTRVRQILVNLISNAIKFTELGSVTLRVDYVVEPEPSLRFVVIDTGIGMSDKQRSEVLEAFTQADSSICRRFGGSGLGLTISKQLIDMLGGQLSIDSKLGAGTSVTLIVPVGPVATLVLKTPTIRHATMPAEVQPSIRLPYRILIVDDRLDVQHMVQSVLEDAGAEVIPANDGGAALQSFSAAAANPFDAMVLDMHMPGINGFEVVRQLRASGTRIPIVALTADAMMGTREKCLAVGCTDYFTKPIDQNALLMCLHRRLRETAASNGASHCIAEYERSSEPFTEKLSIESEQTIDSGGENILVIEDHHDSAHILASLLEEYGHTVRCAGTAREARAQLELITPSLVLSDIRLPDEDGYSLVASLRERPELAHCRFIALSGYDKLDDARGGVFEAHIIKPFDIEDLLALIDDSGTLPVSGTDGTTASRAH